MGAWEEGATGLQRWTDPLPSRHWWPVALLALVGLIGLLVLAARPMSGPSTLHIFTTQERPYPVALEPPVARTIDLNHASQAELETLPGIGSDRALGIIAARLRAPIRSLSDAVERGVLTRAVATLLTELVSVEPTVTDP